MWDGAWHHVAATFDGNYLRLYVDGVEIGTPDRLPSGADLGGAFGFLPIFINYDFPPLTHSRTFNIGNFDRSTPFGFEGDIDDVRIWTRALSPEEILLRAMR